MRQRWRLWLAPTIACTAVGVLCALAMSRTWEATQAIIVRQEAALSQEERPGSFSNLEEMKRTQETILEIAKSRSVLLATLEEVGPPPSLTKWGTWPTDKDIEGLRRNIRMTPPGGAEFGMTEVVYLAVRSEDRQRALQLITALCKQLEHRFMQVRDERAQSVLVELEKTVALAEHDLQAATAELAAFEAGVGADLTELRMLLESSSGTSDIRQKLVAMENSKQEYAAQLQQQKQLLQMLFAAQEDPLALVATPNSLLDAQPALRRLKEGLIEAQLVTSRLLGRLSVTHPDVIAAQYAEAEVRENLRRELGTAIRGVEVDLTISTDRLAAIEAEIAEGTLRLEKLATLRARYANLVALTEDRGQLLEQARMHLAEAHASQASARAASLIGRIDAAHVGTNPVGPGRLLIAGAGCAGGLAIGLALVFLFALPANVGHVADERRIVVDERLEPVALAVMSQREPHVAGAVLAASDASLEFGMFRGKSLRQALEEVRRRGADEVAQVSDHVHG
jgi:uncharacterized protein involved in exopolysaccharide biosynthesis